VTLSGSFIKQRKTSLRAPIAKSVWWLATDWTIVEMRFDSRQDKFFLLRGIHVASRHNALSHPMGIGEKRPERESVISTPYRVEIKSSVEPYIHSPISLNGAVLNQLNIRTVCYYVKLRFCRPTHVEKILCYRDQRLLCSLALNEFCKFSSRLYLCISYYSQDKQH
jgi:hypothetical protein